MSPALLAVALMTVCSVAAFTLAFGTVVAIPSAIGSLIGLLTLLASAAFSE